jgi:hypothetical protein
MLAEQGGMKADFSLIPPLKRWENFFPEHSLEE